MMRAKDYRIETILEQSQKKIKKTKTNNNNDNNK
jgi:hypothetical protein